MRKPEVSLSVVTGCIGLKWPRINHSRTSDELGDGVTARAIRPSAIIA